MTPIQHGTIASTPCAEPFDQNCPDARFLHGPSRLGDWQGVKAFGWPCRCMMYSWDGVPRNVNSGVVLSNMPGAPNLAITLSNTSGTFDGRYLIPKDMPLIGGMSLVLDPIWFGMTVNTLFYAMLTWLVVFGMFALRRHRRGRQGRCGQCGYDLAGLVTCPECGTGAR